MTHRPRALIVDDTLLVRWALHESLGELGFEVMTAGTRAEMLEQLIGSGISLVVASPSMGREDVTDLLEMVRRQQPETAMILLTADESIREPKAWGERTIVFEKPFSVAEVRAAVQRLVPGAAGTLVYFENRNCCASAGRADEPNDRY